MQVGPSAAMLNAIGSLPQTTPASSGRAPSGSAVEGATARPRSSQPETLAAMRSGGRPFSSEVATADRVNIPETAPTRPLRRGSLVDIRA